MTEEPQDDEEPGTPEQRISDWDRWWAETRAHVAEMRSKGERFPGRQEIDDMLYDPETGLPH